MACNRPAGMASTPDAPLNSEEITSEKARPIQSLDGSAPRFSKRRIAIRCGDGPWACRWHADRKARARMASVKSSLLQYTRLQREQVLKLLHVPHCREFRIFFQ